jgi:hypothetical protein
LFLIIVVPIIVLVLVWRKLRKKNEIEAIVLREGNNFHKKFVNDGTDFNFKISEDDDKEYRVSKAGLFRVRGFKAFISKYKKYKIVFRENNVNPIIGASPFVSSFVLFKVKHSRAISSFLKELISREWGSVGKVFIILFVLGVLALIYMRWNGMI